MQLININDIDDLTDFILNGTYTDSQLKKVLKETLGMYLIAEEINKEKIVKQVLKHFEKYKDRIERPLFLMHNQY